jgi:3-deoxy-D-arabino-heptulosonate 7-phosphate (DAHP) synthase
MILDVAGLLEERPYVLNQPSRLAGRRLELHSLLRCRDPRRLAVIGPPEQADVLNAHISDETT